MNQQKRIDKILEAVEARMQDEVGALLGSDLTLLGDEKKTVSKGDAFEELKGKQVCAQMDISGDVSGTGCLLIGIKDAIRLGGTLIMLPSSELDEVIGREDYSEELEDSYGEIANIIAGAFTKDFEEMYPKSCRFVRKEQDVLHPAKVEVEADSPIENQVYYQVPFSMVLDGKQMGKMVMLMPAEPFELVEDQVAQNDTISTLDSSGSPPESNSANISGSEEDGPEINKSEEVSAPSPSSSTFNVQQHKSRVDKLLAECLLKVEEEVGALTGADISLSDLENRIVSKEEFFQDQVSGSQVLADLDVEGDVQGRGYLSLGQKDAIHLGGILIMLPAAELEKVVKENDFSEDSRDAYGEIANIIAGVYTAVFEEQYIQKLRFIRKELHEVIPAKVDIVSQEPIPDTSYYSSSQSLTVNGKVLGKMHLLFPAELLQLQSLVEPDKPATAPASVTSHNAAEVTEKDSPPDQINEVSSAPAEQIQQQGAAANVERLDLEKHKKRVDKILAHCRERMTEEVSALLGTDITLSTAENLLVTKEDFFFEEVSGQQVVADLDVVGELEGKSYLSVSLRDAIRIGGSLIMLPESELESAVIAEEFGEDTQDAYGEIANIISGVYTAVFEEEYIKKVRFIKTGLQQVTPMKVDIGSEEPFGDQDYYLSRMDLCFGELELGKICLLFPAELLQLDGLRPETAIEIEENNRQTGTEQFIQDQQAGGSEHKADTGGDNSKQLEILVIGDNGSEAARIVEVLGRSGYTSKTLSFKDNLHNYIPGNLKAIYLVMEDVNEQAFGIAIKVSSACSVPLIAAGPDWTRKKVIKAVKYGVRDILLTPASEQDIVENVNQNLFELAA